MKRLSVSANQTTEMNRKIAYLSKKLMMFILLVYVSQLNAQISFVDSTALLGSNHRSFYPAGICDVTGDGLEDLIIIGFDTIMPPNSSHLIVEQQLPSGGFVTSNVLSYNSNLMWSMCVGDIDNNGNYDIVFAGLDSVNLIEIDSQLSVIHSTKIGKPLFAQTSNMVDINNDGLLDIFVCNDTAENLGLINRANRQFDIDTSWFPVSNHGGNYASLWSDFNNDGNIDMYLSKCYGLSSNPADSTRINLLYTNTANGFSVSLPSIGVNDGSQTWAADFGDIDNDGDMDLYILNHAQGSKLFENVGNQFIDITAASNLTTSVTINSFQCFLKDFDNDGFLDLIELGGRTRIFRNNGNKTFTQMLVNSLPAFSSESGAVGDVNNDGFLDVYLSMKNIVNDLLYLNVGNTNNYLKVKLKGNVSNQMGIGAKIEVHTTMGMQIREVRSGESFGIVTPLAAHFGLDSIQTVDSIVVHWPSGITTTTFNVSANQRIVINESTIVGLSSNSIQERQLNVYPNPAKESFTIDFEQKQNNIEVKIVSITGKLITTLYRQQADQISIDSKNLESGVYFVQTKLSDKTYTNKVVIH